MYLFLHPCGLYTLWFILHWTHSTSVNLWEFAYAHCKIELWKRRTRKNTNSNTSLFIVFGPSLINNHSHWWIKTCEWNLCYVMSNFQSSLRSNKIRQHQPCLISPTPLGFIRPGMVCMYIFFIVCFLKRVEFSSKKNCRINFWKI